MKIILIIVTGKNIITIYYYYYCYYKLLVLSLLFKNKTKLIDIQYIHRKLAITITVNYNLFCNQITQV